MPDAALSVSSSPLAASLPGGIADSAIPAAGVAGATDPFAALLASASLTKNAPGKAGFATGVAALLAGTAPTAPGAVAKPAPPAAPTPDSAVAIVAPPVPATPDAIPAIKTMPAPASDVPATEIALPQPVSDTEPSALNQTRKAPFPARAAIVAALLSPAQSSAPAATAAPSAPKGKKSDASDDATSKRKDAPDPLADAIASGATAVLALAPTIVATADAPPPAQAPVETATPVRIDAPAAARPAKLAPVADPSAVPQFQPASSTEASQAKAEADPATTPPIAPDGAQADTRTSHQQTNPQQSSAQTKPADAQLPSEIAEAVAAVLKQARNAPAAPADAPADPDPASVAGRRIRPHQPEQTQRPAMQQQPTQQQAAPQQTARRRSDEVSAPRRTGDTRKRVDDAQTDAASAGPAPRAPEAMRDAAAPAVPDVRAKDDVVLQQTLTIARDGAWLDRLAKDIANASDGSDLHFRLNPENLGALAVAISQSADGASIRLTADNDATRNILLDAQPKLIAEAHAQGLKISDTQVDVRQDQSQNQNQTQNQGQNQSQNQSAHQDASRWAQSNSGHGGMSQQGQNRQSSPDHQPFVSNLRRKAEADSESLSGDSDARYA